MGINEGKGLSLVHRLSEGSCAIIWRYMPTPESSDGAGDETCLLTGVRVAALVNEMFRVLFAVAGAAGGDRGLESHAGLVTVAFADWLSSCGGGRRDAGVPWVLRLAGRFEFGDSPETRRVPNFAFADDSLPYEGDPPDPPLRPP